jgi:hypothetical protein
VTPTPLPDRALAAAFGFARGEWPRLARKVVYRMQRIPASGSFSEDYRHRTLWDEYCHEVQNGPHGIMEEAWEVAVDGILAGVVDGLPPHSAAVLTIDAEAEFANGDEPGPIWRDGLIDRLRRQVSGPAADRDLDRFEAECW